ncbi:hypothetical protein AGMMS49921_08530 [Endomicrobiia bacterium]|nr:hypothetical protein AGMMS49921_08530 [Endomicrobiia bacterium]
MRRANETKTKVVSAISSAIVLFGSMLSSCDKKNAFLVNRRTATPEKVKEIKRAKEEKAEEERIRQAEAAEH